jgi:hypothetical protein
VDRQTASVVKAMYPHEARIVLHSDHQMQSQNAAEMRASLDPRTLFRVSVTAERRVKRLRFKDASGTCRFGSSMATSHLLGQSPQFIHREDCRLIMFNECFITIVERLHGAKHAVLLGELSGTTERTWRTRLKQGWDPSNEERAEFSEKIGRALTRHLINNGKWTQEEACAIIAGIPSASAAAWLPTADLVYGFSPHNAAFCQETLVLAIRFDRDCELLRNAAQSGDVDAARDVLFGMLDWLISFCPQDEDIDDIPPIRAQLYASTTLESLLAAAAPLQEALLLHVLSCWDVEFCASYFDNTMKAFPLFQLVMPRFAPGIVIDPETGRLSRNGRPPKGRVLVTATSRLFDFLFFLAAWRREQRLPQSLPRMKDIVAWFDQNETQLVNWRDETTRFTARELAAWWCGVLDPDENGVYPSIPFPLFVCAHLWSPLLLRENGRRTGLIDCAAHYRIWWERHHVRLVGKGLRFGAQAWPSYFSGDGGKGASVPSGGAVQSSGRSSSPRDCQ